MPLLDLTSVGAMQRALAASREACPIGMIPKPILKTGALGPPERIGNAGKPGIDPGVDFLKTLTGKASVGATPVGATVMLNLIAETGGRCGFKAAGDIRTLADAAHFRTGGRSLFIGIGAALAEAA